MHYRLFAENRIHKFGLYQSKLMQGHTEIYNSKTEIFEITYINEKKCILSFKFNAWLVHTFETFVGGGRVVRWCWVNFQCRGVLQFGLQ